MQWLIDIIKEWCISQGYLTAGFVDRGDAPDYDFTEATLINDSNYHDLDLSSICPQNAKGVVLAVYLVCLSVPRSFKLKTKGNVNDFNITRCNVTLSDLPASFDCTVPLDNNRKISYWLEATTWTRARVTVKGWWF